MEPMAAETYGLIQDHNLSIQNKGDYVGGRNNTSKAPKKSVVGGRKALTDVTNSGKPSLKIAQEKSHVKKLSTVGEETRVSKTISSFGKSSKDREKVLFGRKALADVTNAGKLNLDKKNSSMKLDAIAEEQCLHNHQECIKSQRRAMEAQFPFTLGLDDDFSMQFASPAPRIVTVSRQAKAEIPSKHLELEEIPEFVFEDRSPPRFQTLPESPNASPYWDWHGYQSSPNLVLKGTP